MKFFLNFFRSTALSGHWRMESYVEDQYEADVYYFMHENMTRQKMNKVLKTATGFQHFSKDLRCIGRYDWGWHCHCDKAGQKICKKIDKIKGNAPPMFRMGANFILITEEVVHEFLGNVKSVKTIEDMKKFDFSKTLSSAIDGDWVFGGLVLENEKLAGICIAASAMHDLNFDTLKAKI